MRYIETYLTPARILVGTLLALVAIVAVGTTLGLWLATSRREVNREVSAETVREYVLTISPTDIE